MKLTKSNKILILLGVLLLSIVMTFATIGFFGVKAEGAYSVESDYVKIDGNKLYIAKDVLYSVNDIKVKKDSTSVDFTSLKFKVGASECDFFTLGGTKEKFVFSQTTPTVADEVEIFNGDETTGFKLVVVEDKNAPTYSSDFTTNFEAKKTAYETALAENVKDASTNTCIPVGSGKYLTLPSLSEFVEDATTTYKGMKYKVYYKVNSTDRTPYTGGTISSDKSFKMPVKEAGKYTFYVAFIDALGKEMKEEACENFVFEFTIYDDYPVKVEAKSATVNAVLDKEYKAGTSMFTVTGATSQTYELQYSENNEEDSFVALTEEEKTAVKFNKSDLSFTPNKEGYYKLICNAVKDSITNDAEVVIHVSKVEEADETDAEKDENSFGKWVSEHVLSVVFFGIGVLCLIAIIVLLCIKPKDAQDDETLVNEKEDKKNVK